VNALRSLFADTVTLYNYASFKDSGAGGRRQVWKRAVIGGVQWREKIYRSQDSGGIVTFTTSVSVTIPVTARVSGGKRYVAPDTYAGLIGNNTDGAYWTLDNSGNDVIVFGDCPAEIGGEYALADLKREYPRHCVISAVSDATHPAFLKHWRVTGV
jgi:hypothetical protein